MLKCGAKSHIVFNCQAFPLAFQWDGSGKAALAHIRMFLKVLWRENKTSSSKASSVESISGLNTFNSVMTLMKPCLFFYQGQHLLPFPSEFKGSV